MKTFNFTFSGLGIKNWQSLGWYMYLYLTIFFIKTRYFFDYEIRTSNCNLCIHNIIFLYLLLYHTNTKNEINNKIYGKVSEKTKMETKKNSSCRMERAIKQHIRFHIGTVFLFFQKRTVTLVPYKLREPSPTIIISAIVHTDKYHHFSLLVFHCSLSFEFIQNFLSLHTPS